MRKFIMSLILTVMAAFVMTVGVQADTVGVYDPHDYLSPTTEQNLVKTSEEVNIGYYIVNHVDGESIETVADQIAQEWRRDYFTTDDSILVYVAVEDRKIRIATSNNVRESKMTDDRAKQLVDDEKFKNAMREQRYDQGLLILSTNIEQSLRNDTVTTWQYTSNDEVTEGLVQWSTKPTPPLDMKWLYLTVLVFGISFVILLVSSVIWLPQDTEKHYPGRTYPPKYVNQRSSYGGLSNKTLRSTNNLTSAMTNTAFIHTTLYDHTSSSSDTSSSSSSIDIGGFDGGGASGDW